MILDEIDDRFYVAPSTVAGAGHGLFARVPLSPGDRLAIVGVTIARDSLADRCTAFADAYKLRLGEQLLVIPCGFGAMINHSSRPNLQKLVDGDTLSVTVVRPVAAGEELLLAYSEYARERFGIEDDTVGTGPVRPSDA